MKTEQEEYLSFGGLAYGASSTDGIQLKQRSNAVYIQDQLSLLDSRLQFTAAARAQFFDLKQPTFQGTTTNPYEGQIGSLDVPTAYTGDGAIAYFVESSGTKFRAHVGNSFRAPSGYERFGGGFGSYYGDPRLAAERAVAFDTGIDQYLLDSRLELSGTFFYTNLQQTIRFASSFPPGTDPFNRTFGGYANGGGGIARGMEFSGRFSPTANTKLSGLLHVLELGFPQADPRLNLLQGARCFASRVHVIGHAMDRSQNQRDIRYGSSQRLRHGSVRRSVRQPSRLFRFNGPVKGDVMVRHDLPFGDDHTVEIYGKVENVFNQRPYEDGFIGPKAWVTAGARVNF